MLVLHENSSKSLDGIYGGLPWIPNPAIFTEADSLDRITTNPILRRLEPVLFVSNNSNAAFPRDQKVDEKVSKVFFDI